MAVVQIGPRRRRVLNADGLTPDQALIWREIVQSMPDGHFHASDKPLLRNYVELTERIQIAQKRLSKSIVNRDGEISPWLRVYDLSAKLHATLATRLRLSPASRVDRTKMPRIVGQDPTVQPWGKGDDQDSGEHAEGSSG